MVSIRRAAERGPSTLGWLKSQHSFSFGHYHDPRYMGFESLRVINQDRVMPGAGFGTHPHSNMEIISYVLEGSLEHRDSMGNGSVIRPGEVQRLSAGAGITHSEYNHSDTDEVHFLQIWFLPEASGVEPGYAQKTFAEQDKRGRFCLVASREGREGSLTLHQDVDMSIALIDGAERVAYEVAPERALWVQVARGEVHMNGELLQAGDGCSLYGAADTVFTDGRNAEVILFDMKAVAAKCQG